MSIHAPYGELSGITLFVIGTQDNIKDSFVDVKYQDATKQNAPYPGGVSDLHMGTTELEWPCSTCQHTKRKCPGHPGIIKLKYPIQSPLFLKEIQKWAKVICCNCSKEILPREKLQAMIDSKMKRDQILNSYVKLVRTTANKGNVVCAHCNAIHPHIIKDKSDNLSLFKEFYESTDSSGASGAKQKRINKAPILYPAHELEACFNKITDETVLRFGKPLICHPKKYIWRALRASPNTIRPDLRKLGSGRSSSNDVTVLLQNIVKVNDKLPEETPREVVHGSDLAGQIHLLELHAYEMIKGSSNAAKRSLSNNSKKPLISIAKRLPRKLGRIRRNLMGRRANNMARSFITCDPSLPADVVGVPISVARSIPMPVHVQQYNYEECMMYFMNGEHMYPGCVKVKKASTGNYHSIRKISDDFKLEIGDIIYRDLIDGDIVDFNRQPSLEASSVSSMKVRVMRYGDTFRLNVTGCSLFNADFDGDAMNLIIPRTARTVNEIAILSSPKQRFVSYKNSSPVIGEAQDSLIGTAELTRTKTMMDKLHAMRMFNGIPVQHDFSAYPSNKLFSGREVVSMLFQETGLLINFNRNARYYDQNQAPYRRYEPKDIKVEIDRGVIKSGVLDKNSIGEGENGGIFHIVHNQYGPQAAIKLSFELQQMALTYLYNKGVTVSIRDLLINRTALQEIHKIESGLIAESHQITNRLNTGKIIAPLGKTIGQHYEALQKEALNPGDKLWPPLLSSIDPEYNNFDKLIMYGSKGKLDNFRNIATAVGQIEINGERMKEDYGRRALPYHTRYSPDPRSRGHIPNSYMSGLRVDEEFFHAQEARYQLINKALSTSITGMYNRMAVKNLESHITDNMRKVDKSGRIIQLLYGGDGVDPRFLERVVLPTAKADLTHDKFKELFDGTTLATALYKARKAKLGQQEMQALAGEFAQLKFDRERYIKTYLPREFSVGKVYQESVQVPVNVKRIIDDALYNLGLKHSSAKKENNLNVLAAVSTVQTLCQNLVYGLLNEIQERLQSKVPDYMRRSTTLMEILIRSYLNIATMIRMGITNEALEIITTGIKMTFLKSLISYGCAVGIIAAQSISEPLTQMVLDAHQSSGVESTKKKGMSRVSEILNGRETAKMKSPTMNVYVLPEYRNSKSKVQSIANQIEMLSVSQFVLRWDIFYEAYGKPVHSKYAHEAKTIKEFERYNLHVKPPSDLINWCIRFQINKFMLVEKQITMDIINEAIRNKYSFIHIVYTTDNSDNMIMRLYMRSTIAKKGPITRDQMRLLTKLIMSTVVRGINGIKATYVKEANRNFYQPDGSIKAEKIYYILTDGTNMNGILMTPWVDKRLVQSDSIQETRECFGIEEADAKIISELDEQIRSVASYRHLTIYAREMTYTGAVTSIDRYGSAKRETNFMLRISDASPLSVIEWSAANAMHDSLEGVSAPIMLGKNPHIGDLYNTFKIDEPYVNENIRSLDQLLDAL
jgi:DNA-directed RNA polymerase II subunit RPB1